MVAQLLHWTIVVLIIVQVILAGMFGFAEDATLLKFSDSEPTAVAPKLNF